VKGELWLARMATAGASVALALAGLYPGNNPDTFGHLAQGRQIAELGYVPQRDTWSLLPGAPRAWHNYEWLSDLGTWLLYANAGYVAVTLFKCLLLVLTVLFLTKSAFLVAGSRASVLTSLALISTIPAIRTRLSDRPHILGICFAAAYLLLLTLLSQRIAANAPRRGTIMLVAALAALHLVWVNAHGSHLLGLGITTSFVALSAREARRWIAMVGGLQLLASCLSPYGPAILFDAIDHVVDPRYRHLVTEWQAWRETDPPWLQIGPALHGGALALLIPALLRSGPSARAALPTALLLGVACFRSIRFLAEFMLLTSPLIGAGLAKLTRDLTTARFARTSAVVALALAVAVPVGSAALPPLVPLGARISFAGLPLAAGAMLDRHAKQARVFAPMQDSWYLMFAAPRSRFAIDGRVPFYGPDHVARVSMAFGSRQRFESLHRELQFDTVIIGYAASGEQQVSEFIERDPAWQLVLIEDLHATYVKRGVLDSAGAQNYPPLTALRPEYGTTWIVQTGQTRRAAMQRELAHLSKVEGTGGYRAWVEGVLALAPLRRGRPEDGFRWPRSEADWAAYRDARALIDQAAAHAADVPVVSALQSLLAAIFCDFDVADVALARALVEGASREPLLAAQEIALRKGDRDKVRALVEAGRAMPAGAGDAWLAELAAGLSSAPSCPTTAQAR
jgi:hypothetical protein